MSELNRLRQQVYQAADEYHQAMGKYFAAKHGDDPAERVATAKVSRAAGKKYRSALDDLLSHLIPDKSEDDKNEKQWAATLIENLNRELALLLR